MDRSGDRRSEQGGTQQVIQVENGSGYGVIGADLHVFQDRGPIYLLTEHRSTAGPGNSWLIAQPSRMLNARWQVVRFAGRERELAGLTAWRDRRGSRLAVRWLHAPGGQGKTRLAAKLAADSRSVGWKVVNILHGTAGTPPGSHDMRRGDCRGLLLIADYADRWPVSHLRWLLSNSIFHQPLPTRLLLLSRTPHPWPAIRAILDDLQADTSIELLEPLPGDAGHERERMFRFARDCFASRYGLSDMERIQPPGTITESDFGLTLAVHMAALVAVDARASGARVPEDMAGLTAYLLDRERAHWAQLYENRLEGAEFRTPPRLMARSVFTAAITGPVPHASGVEIMRRLEVEDPDQALSDHAVCYPPVNPAAVLEPLYPDRLAEDFLALAIPGHTVDAHPATPWSVPTLETLAKPDWLGLPPTYTSRAITFLASAAARWPHVTSNLEEILRAEPGLAVIAGNAALTGIASVDSISHEVLEAIADRFPERDFDIAPGIAAISARVARYKIGKAANAAEQARIHDYLARRQADAGLYPESLSETRQAADIWRRLAAEDSSHEDALASSLTNLGNRLHILSRAPEAISALEEAVAIRRHLAAGNFRHQASLANSLRVLGSNLSAVGRRQEALTVTQESVAILRRITIDHPVYAEFLASSLHNLGNRLSELGQTQEALAATEQAVIIERRLTEEDAGAHAPDLAISLYNLGKDLWRARRFEEAVDVTGQAASVYRRLTVSNPARYEPGLAWALREYSDRLRSMERFSDALPPLKEAEVVWRRLAKAEPATYEPILAGVLINLSGLLNEEGRWDDAEAASEEAVAIRRRYLGTNPDVDDISLAKALICLGVDRAEAGRPDAAIAPTEEAVVIFRRAADNNPETFIPEVGKALHNLSEILASAGRPNDALETATECATLYQELVSRDPDKYKARLAMILDVVRKLEAHST